jgi:hypothetical protein
MLGPFYRRWKSRAHGTQSGTRESSHSVLKYGTDLRSKAGVECKLVDKVPTIIIGINVPTGLVAEHMIQLEACWSCHVNGTANDCEISKFVISNKGKVLKVRTIPWSC